MKRSQKTKTLLLKVAIHLAALLPIINLYIDAFADQLGADPVKAVIHYTGIGAFNLLLITLCISPLAKLLKQSFLMNVRRLLGLYAFTYTLLHLINFIASTTPILSLGIYALLPFIKNSLKASGTDFE